MQLNWKAPTKTDVIEIKDLFSICDEDGSDKIEYEDLGVIFDKDPDDDQEDEVERDREEEKRQFKLA